MRRAQLILLLSGLIGILPPAYSNQIDVGAKSVLESRLRAAGDHRKELEKALSLVSAEERPAMEFLISYMPVGDLVSLDADFLLVNHREAYAARNNRPWARMVPEKIFFNDVLPYAALNERREPWRTDLRKRFNPIVAPARNLREATILLNHAIRDELKVDYNTNRLKPDQSPHESIAQGMASCSGLSILLCDALRSVGIPSRIAGTAAWTSKVGNHNWVEFYDPDTASWHFTEYYPDQNGFDRGWLISDASKAIAGHPLYGIYASSWQSTGRVFPLIWNLADHSVPGVDVTTRYIGYAGKLPQIPDHHCELRIDWKSGNGQRVAVQAEVLADGKVIASGMTPGATADMNDFLTIRVPQVAHYQVRFAGDSAPVAIEVKKSIPWLRVSGQESQ